MTKTREGRQLELGEERLLERLDDMATQIAQQGKAGKFWDYAFKAMIPLAIILGGAMIRGEIKDHEQDAVIAQIRGSRFTDRDGVALEMRLRSRPVEAWLKEDISEIKALVRSMDERMRVLERGGD